MGLRHRDDPDSRGWKNGLFPPSPLLRMDGIGRCCGNFSFCDKTKGRKPWHGSYTCLSHAAKNKFTINTIGAETSEEN